MKTVITLLLLFCTTGVYTSLAQSGTNDPSFNTYDDCDQGDSPGFDLRVYALARQTDGKIIAGGDFTTYNGTARNRIVRINTDGTIDFSFNPGTGFSGNFPSLSIPGVQAVAIQTDGKIIATGNFTQFNGNFRNGIVRLNADGSLDPTFNVGSGINTIGYALHIQDDGKILVGGAFTTYNGVTQNRIVRLNTNGSPDATFITGTGFNNAVRAITKQSTGKLLIGGGFATYDGVSRGCFARLNTDGTNDLTMVIGTGFSSDVRTISVQPDDKIVVGGNFGMYNGTTKTRLARLGANGALETAFNPGGGFGSGVYTTHIQSDGKILVGGAFITVDFVTMYKMVRLTASGILDPGFNAGPDNQSGEAVNASILEPDGRIVIAGNILCITSLNTVNHIMRLETNGTYEDNYNHGSGFQVAEVGHLSVLPNDKIIASGIFFSYNGVECKGIARLNADGSYDPSFDIGTGTNNQSTTSAVQADGKVVIAGGFTTYNGITAQSIARLNTDGTLDNTYITGTGFSGYVLCSAIQPDGKIIFGGQMSAYNGTTIGKIVRLNTDGTIDPTFNIGGVGFNQIVYDIAIQPDGNIVVGGIFTQLNGVTCNRIVRLTSTGAVDPSFTVGTGISGLLPSNLVTTVKSIILQPDNKVILAGNFTSYNGNSRNGMVRLNSNGTIDATFAINVGFNDMVQDIAIQPDGKIVAVGEFTMFNVYTRNGIARLNTNGTVDNTLNPGTGFNNYARAIAFQSSGRMIVGGEFTNYNGNCRSRIARLYNCESVSTDSHVACNAYTWMDGTSYTSSNNTATYVIPNMSGCDSIITLDLTINNTANGIATHSSCGPFTWIDGNTYATSNNTATHTIVGGSSSGCDSLVTLNLTVNNSTTGTAVVNACNSYTWINGTTYTSSNNTATHNIVGGSSTGCDSLVTLNLTIANSTTGTDVVSACNSYIWINGVTYTSSNNTATYNIVGGAANGCDSLVTLNLTINSITTSVSQAGIILTANSTGATSYQWLNCNTGYSPISGETNASFTPTSNGSYAVRIVENGCTDTSACILVNNVGISENSVYAILVYPNPNNGHFFVDQGTDYANVQLNLINGLGQMVKPIKNNTSQILEIDLNGMSGVYYLELFHNSGKQVYKLVVN